MRKLFFFFAGMLLLALVAHLAFDLASTSRLESVKQDLRERGMPLEVTDLFNTNQNERDENKPTMMDVQDRMTSLSLCVSTEFSSSGCVSMSDVWHFDTPEREAIVKFIDLTRAVEISPEKATAEDLAHLIYFYDNNPEFWDCWRDMAKCKSIFVFKKPFEGDSYALRRFMREAQVRWGPQIAFAVSIALAREGRTEEALEVWRMPLEASRIMLKKAVNLTGFYAAMRYWKVALEISHYFTRIGIADASMLRGMLETVGDVTVYKGFRETKKLEFFFMLNQYKERTQKIYKEGKGRSATESILYQVQKRYTKTFGIEQKLSPENLKVLAYPIGKTLKLAKPYCEWVIADVSEVFTQYLDLMELEPWEWERTAREMGLEPEDAEKYPKQEYGDIILKARTFVTWECWYFRAFAAPMNTQAFIDTTRLGLACELWRIENGNWPESLDALVPEYLDALPPDPGTGKPFKYERTEDAITILSTLSMNFHVRIDERYWEQKEEAIGWRRSLIEEEETSIERSYNNLYPRDIIRRYY